MVDSSVLYLGDMDGEFISILKNNWCINILQYIFIDYTIIIILCNFYLGGTEVIAVITLFNTKLGHYIMDVLDHPV